MIKTALASAAVLGAVMVAPAQATVPAPVNSVYNSVDLTTYTSLVAAFTAAWDEYFGFAAPSVGTLGLNTITYYGSGISYRYMSASFAGLDEGNMPLYSGTLQMPVPGPIAGAGLPLLAAGIAFAAWRRRRAANAA